MDAEEDDEEDEDDEVEKSDEEDGMSKEESMKSAKAMAQRLMGAKDADEEEKCMKEMKEESKKWFLPIKGEKDMSKKSVVKADGTIDLTAVPVEVRPAVEAIYKSQQELVKKNADLTEALKSERQERRKKDFIAKAAEFKHFTGDRAALATQLMDLEETNKGLYETVVKQLNDVEAQKESVAKSLFSEIGSTMGGSSDVEGKIDAAVAGMVQKSNGELSKAQAYTRFIQSDEGQKLYAEFKAGRKGGI